MSIQRIVVGIDFTDASINAARWASLCFGQHAELVLVHSVFIPQPPRLLRGSEPATEALEGTARLGAQQELRVIGAMLNARQSSTRVCIGKPDEELARVAKECDANLIVVGKHTKRPHGIPRAEGTAEHVVRLAHIPVVIVSDTATEKPRRVLAAVDDSSVTPAVIECAAGLAAEWEADVTVLQVVSAAVMSHVLSMASIGAEHDVEPTREFVQSEFQEDVTRWETQLRSVGVPASRAHSEIAYGNPGQEIIAAAERLGCALIVLGDTGVGAVPRMLLGSTLRDVTRAARCPVLVVGRPTKAGG